MKKSSLTLFISLGCLMGFNFIYGTYGENLTKYQQTILYMLTYLSISKILD